MEGALRPDFHIGTNAAAGSPYSGRRRPSCRRTFAPPFPPAARTEAALTGWLPRERRSANWLQGSPDPCWLALRALPGPESPQSFLLWRGGALEDDLSTDDGDGGFDGEDVRFRDRHDVTREAGEVGELAGLDGAEVFLLE
jgi:hypothetical protein